jgi:stage IV sporulation protein FB
MFQDSEASSPYDVNFHISGIPIRVSPWFWLSTVLLGMGASEGGDPQRLLLWVAACFASILIHELGHALAFRWHGVESRIVLYQFGGLAVPTGLGAGWNSRRSLSRSYAITVSAAGPLAQFAAAAALMAGIHASGFTIPLDGFVAQWLRLPRDLPPLASPKLHDFSAFFLYVSVYWGLLNLLPVLPLDGGQIAREIFLVFDRSKPIQHALLLSTITAGFLAVRGFLQNDMYFGMMFGMLAYSNFNALQAHSGSGFGRRW